MQNISSRLSTEQREFLIKFFCNNLNWIKERDMLDPEDIRKFIDLYSECLEKSLFCDDSLLKLFLFELKISLFHELKVKNGEIDLTIKERVLRMSVPSTSAGLYKCKNNVIRRWYNESLVFRTVSRADFVAVDKSITPKIEQNKLERKLSWEAAKDIWVK